MFTSSVAVMFTLAALSNDKLPAPALVKLLIVTVASLKLTVPLAVILLIVKLPSVPSVPTSSIVCEPVGVVLLPAVVPSKVPVNVVLELETSTITVPSLLTTSPAKVARSLHHLNKV